MLKDFKTFLMRGNVMDLAVGVIIGGAFGKIVTSLVTDILTPMISVITGGVDFSGVHVRIGGTDAVPVVMTYGKFIQAAIDFVIIGAVIYGLVKIMNSVRTPADAPATMKDCPRCLMSVPIKATRCPHCTSEL